jgi:hypothetical protein
MFIVAGIWASDLTNQYALSTCKISCMQLVTNIAMLCRNKVPQVFFWNTIYFIILLVEELCWVWDMLKRWSSGFYKFQQNQSGVTEDVVLCCWVSGYWHLEGTSHPVMQHNIPPPKKKWNSILNWISHSPWKGTSDDLSNTCCEVLNTCIWDVFCCIYMSRLTRALCEKYLAKE